MTRRSTRQTLLAFVAGLVFSAGLALGGMTSPKNVLGFLDVAGDWNPQLMLVMGGAVLIFAPAYRLIRRRQAPLLSATFDVAEPRKVDAVLILGAAIFGIGWGLVGLCPGPAFAAVGTGTSTAVTFVLSMFLGMGAATAFAKTPKGDDS